MLATAHLFIGAVIGKYFNNIFLVIILAFLSHYILDAVPHYNPKALSSKKLNLKFILEVILKSIEPVIGILFVLLIASHDPKSGLIMIGAFFAFLPDLMDGILWTLGGKFKEFKYFMNKYHHHSKFMRGILPQIAVVVLAIMLL